MITTALLNLLFYIVSGLLSLLPALDFPWTYNIANALTTLATYIQKANMFIPVNHIFIVIGAAVSVPLFKFMFFVVNWIIRRISDVIP